MTEQVIEEKPDLAKEENEIIRANQDSAWKGVLTDYFKEFLELCWQEAYQNIDWFKKPQFMEQELLALTPEKNSKRATDKLVRVWDKQGEEILIHPEVQAQAKSIFSKRMFRYYYRIFERYDNPIVCIAILTDPSIHWRPSFFTKEKWGCQLKLEFISIKIMDYTKKKQFLLNNKNPFAIVILIQLAAIEAGNNNDLKLEKKFELIQIIYNKNYTKEDIIKLSWFLDGLFILPKLHRLEYYEMVRNLEGINNMSYLSCFEEIGIEKGIEKGLEIGITRGKAQGITQGITQGESKTLKTLLEYKFKKIPKQFIKLIELAKEDQLLEWSKKILHAKKIETVFK